MPEMFTRGVLVPRRTVPFQKFFPLHERQFPG